MTPTKLAARLLEMDADIPQSADDVLAMLPADYLPSLKGNLSQYAQPYLKLNAKLGDGKGLTPASFLALKLSRSQRVAYGSRYRDALERALLVYVQQGLARTGRSVKGSVAYYPV